MGAGSGSRDFRDWLKIADGLSAMVRNGASDLQREVLVDCSPIPRPLAGCGKNRFFVFSKGAAHFRRG